MTKISLEDYLIQHELQPVDQRLSEEKIEILKLARKYADKVNKIVSTNKWELIFIGGTFEGDTVILLNRLQLTPLGLLNCLDKLPIFHKCEQAVLNVMKDDLIK